MDHLRREAAIFDGDDYSEPKPKDLIIRKPTTPPPVGQLGKLFAPLRGKEGESRVPR